VAELIFSEVYKLHGLPKSIISDRDVLFTSTFWDELHKLIGTKLRMSSAYHPESDGGTERAKSYSHANVEAVHQTKPKGLGS